MLRITTFALGLVLSFTAAADNTIFDLTGLNSTAFVIRDTDNTLSDSQESRIALNARLNFKSAGIKTISTKDSKSIVVAKVARHALLASDMVFIQLSLFEPAIINTRAENTPIQTAAVTYVDTAFFKTPSASTDTEAKIEQMLGRLINTYLDANE